MSTNSYPFKVVVMLFGFENRQKDYEEHRLLISQFLRRLGLSGDDFSILDGKTFKNRKAGTMVVSIAFRSDFQDSDKVEAFINSMSFDEKYFTTIV